MKLDELKDVLTPKDLLAVLPCGKNKIYDLLKTGAIKSKKIGHEYIVLKDNFLQFIGVIDDTPDKN